MLANAITVSSARYKAHPRYGVSFLLLGRCLRVANFGESPKGEVRRIPIPRTPVNSIRCAEDGSYRHRCLDGRGGNVLRLWVCSAREGSSIGARTEGTDALHGSDSMPPS